MPAYLAEVEKAQQQDWGKLASKEVLRCMHDWIQLTLFDFARHSLKPTALAALVLGNLERAFAARLRPVNVKPAEAMAIGMQRAQAALRGLMIGVHSDQATDLPDAIRALRERRLSREEFLRRFGHRGNQEMELAHPRWSEDHSDLDAMIDSRPHAPREEGRHGDCEVYKEGVSPLFGGPESPVLANRDDAWQFAWLKLADETRLLPGQRPAVEAELRRLQIYTAWRETAKHHLLRGYALIRRALVELDRRYELKGGIFFLTPNELVDLVNLAEGKAPQVHADLIEQRRWRREIALSLPLPGVIFSDDLDAIGRESHQSEYGAMQGVPLSAGVVEASAWVLADLAGVHVPSEPYILVCPSTDPAWVPLFLQARGLVMETGGMLSHGAIVAREFGLPAVAGIADVQRRIRTGQRLRVDGSTGTVNVLG